ncbi:hypothetical protein OG413_09625 [Streptomyces sp. NBC_01433]|uniref:hypothetical protein n=1 Tax=Streptomyces sp. NBC_01433 TaxID=2903864 RepID=UPI00224D5D83|nr:hypothetical protein [Streptomyces sp. NBC_01433]MCX4675565.1 hypothetical protein [Streptomyces sp. NBC_01433]
MLSTQLRPQVIALAADVDTTHPKAPERLYHLDGRELTDAEYDLFSTITADEISIAVTHKLPDVPDQLNERLKAGKALIDLFMKYVHQAPDSSIDDIFDLMTDEDYEEFERLRAVQSGLLEHDEN